MKGDRFRFDPNAAWSTEQAIWFGQQIEDIKNDYLEDPVFGLHGMRRTREKVRMLWATNTVVVNFEQLASNVLDTAVDVILLDTCSPLKTDTSRQRIEVKRLSPIDIRGGARQELQLPLPDDPLGYHAHIAASRG